MKPFLLVALVLPMAAQAQQALPAKSSIAVVQSNGQVPAVKVGKACILAKKLTIFTPTVRVGADVGDGATWQLFVILKPIKGEPFAQKIAERPIKAGGALPRPIAVAQEWWLCSDCRRSNKELPDIAGWYAQIERDGQVIAKAQSGTKDCAALVAARPKVPGENRDWLQEVYSALHKMSVTGKRASASAKGDQVLKIETSDGAKALVQFVGSGDQSVTYRWRYKKGASGELSGEDRAIGDRSPSVNSSGTAFLARDEDYCPYVQPGDLRFEWQSGQSISFSPDLAKVQVLPASAFDSAL